MLNLSTTQHNTAQGNATCIVPRITTQHYATQLNRYNTTATQRIAAQCNATQRNATKQTQHNGSQHNTTQHNIMDYNTTQRNTTQQNSPQHNKTGNKNHAHMLNKPVEVTSSSTKNSTEKTGQKTLQVYTSYLLGVLRPFCVKENALGYDLTRILASSRHKNTCNVATLKLTCCGTMFVSFQLTVVRQRDKLEGWFKHFLVEDKGVNPAASSYVDFLCQMQEEIRSLMN